MARILVVDDSPDIRESTAMMLALEGYETQVAASGEEALRMAASFLRRRSSAVSSSRMSQSHIMAPW